MQKWREAEALYERASLLMSEAHALFDDDVEGTTVGPLEVRNDQ